MTDWRLVLGFVSRSFHRFMCLYVFVVSEAFLPGINLTDWLNDWLIDWAGLFFMAEVEPGSTTGEPCYASAFGSTRLIVPVDVLLGLAPQLYFADFYCMRGRFHYITLVMTRYRSTADDFCRQHLLPLSIDDELNNPFFFRRAGTGEMRVAQGVKVEVLFTEDIDVNDFLRRRGATKVENVPLIGKGSSTPGGLPKNPNCYVCNLQPPFQLASDLF